MDTEILKVIFAVLVLIVVFLLVTKVDEHHLMIPSEKENAVFGSISGLLTGLFTLNAVPASIYLLWKQYPKKRYMGALVTFLMFSDLLIIAVYLFAELFTLQGFLVSLKLIAIVLVGFFIGIVTRRHASSKHFKALVIFVLVLNSLKIIYDYIM